jgi:hypothetical protein
MLITFLDPTLIPATWGLKIKNDFYRLRFEVEGQQPIIPADVTMTSTPGDDDDPNGNGSGQCEDSGTDREAKRSKGASDNKIDDDPTMKSHVSAGKGNNLMISQVQFGSVDIKDLKSTWSYESEANMADKKSDNSRYMVSNFVDSYPSPKFLEPLFTYVVSSLGSEQQMSVVRLTLMHHRFPL